MLAISLTDAAAQALSEFPSISPAAAGPTQERAQVLQDAMLAMLQVAPAVTPAMLLVAAVVTRATLVAAAVTVGTAAGAAVAVVSPALRDSQGAIHRPF